MQLLCCARRVSTAARRAWQPHLVASHLGQQLLPKVPQPNLRQLLLQAGHLRAWLGCLPGHKDPAAAHV